MKKTKKVVMALLLISIIVQNLTGCSENPSEEEVQQEISQEVKEVESDLSEVRQEMTEMEKDLLGESDEEKQYGDYQTKAEELSTLALEKLGVTSIQYALMDGDEIILSNMAGENDAWNKPVFCMASSSKMYSTAAVMILVDRKEIDLDTPIIQYMPEFSMADERYKEITTRMLLNHSSGLYGTSLLYGNSSSLGAPSTLGKDVFMEYKKTESLKANPGEIAVYCNDGFVLAEFLVEEVSGLSFTDFIKENISKPLGLKYTTTALDPELKLEDITPGITDYGEPVIEYMNYPGTGGMYATTEEMCKFGRLFMGAYPEILSKESAELTLEWEFAKGIWIAEDNPSMVGYGLGWDDVTASSFDKYGIRAASKGGDASFHHADITVLPDHNISMAVLLSGGNSLLGGMISSNVILEYLYSKGVIDDIIDNNFEPVIPVKADMPEELQKYEGLYGFGSAFGKTIQIKIENGELVMSENAGDSRFVYTGDNEFSNEKGTIFVYFKEEMNGETYLIQRNHMMMSGFGETIVEGHHFQKLEPQQLSETVKSAWKVRENKQYFRVNEMYHSSNYLDSVEMILRPDIDLETGYIDGDKIVDETKAVNVFKIPIVGGRDNYDISFFINNGKNYMDKGGLMFIAEEHLVPLDITEKSVVIGKDGYAEWFIIDSDTAQKEVNVTIPEKSSVAVCDENMQFTAFIWVSGENTIKLPAGGFIVFAGDAGTEFELA